MVDIIGPPTNATRCRPINDTLRKLLKSAAEATGIEKIVIVSGGQPSNHDPHLKNVACGWTGSTRHDNGRAADIQLIKNGATLGFTDSDGDKVAPFVTACAARGANGMGAGVNYMGPKTIHVGFGKSTSDTEQLVWGAAGASSNAPQWLRTAARQGWNNPVDNLVAMTALPMLPHMPAASRSTVNARDGLWLRRGPGLDFDRARLLEAGTSLTISGFKGDWAQVDLQGDGLIDGYVFSAFLGLSATDSPDEGIEEPINEALITALLEPSSDKAFSAPIAGLAVALPNSNASKFYKDDPVLAGIRLTPTNVYVLPSGDAKLRAMARTYNAVGGLVDALSKKLSIDPVAFLAVWYVESSGKEFVVNEPVLRFEVHKFFKYWGKDHVKTFDAHFQFGGHAGVSGKASKNHKFRAKAGDPWVKVHIDTQDREYEVFNFAKALADEEAACLSSSFGGPQIMGFNHDALGYGSALALADAFRADERWHVLGFADFCRDKNLVDEIRDQKWTAFGAGYNGDGPTYGPLLKAAFDRKAALLALPKHPNP